MSARAPALRFAAVARRTILILLGSALLALAAPAALGATNTTESTPFFDQGGNSNYRSYITRVSPSVSGLSVQVLEFADRLLLVNHTGKTVTIYGYQNDPYARVLPNGTAERNVRSPATYLNESFYGNITVPPIANPSASPKWEVIDRTGQFEWHDHRIHWPSPLLPPQVKDQSKRTLIFNWSVPIEVGAVKGDVYGQLFWVPDNSKAPVAVIVLGVVIVLAGLLFVIYVRRRRARAAAAGAGSGGPTPPENEAW
jgi:hypothetical protein